MSTLTQEQLPTALNGIFSDSSIISVVSGLRWLCRKTRTPAKPGSIIVEKPHISAYGVGALKTYKETYSTDIKAIQVYRSRKKRTNDLAFMDHNHPVEELHVCRKYIRVNHRSENMSCVIENDDNLFTVPISMMENHEISQNSIEKQDGSSVLTGMKDLSSFQLTAKSSVESCEEHGHCISGLDSTIIVSVPVLYQHKQIYHNISASDSSVLSNDANNVGEYNADSDGVGDKGLELQDCMVIPLLKTSKVKNLTGAVIETSSVPKFHDSVDSSSQLPQLLTADKDEHMQESQVTGEQNTEICPNFSLSAEYHAGASGNGSEMHIEVPIAEELCSENCSVHCPVDFCSNVSPEDKMCKTESLVVQGSIFKAAQIQLKEILLTDNSTADYCEVQHQSFLSEAPDVVSFDDGYAMQKFFDGATDPIGSIASGGNDCSGEVFAVKDERTAGPVNIRSYVRRKNKRKREASPQEAQEYIETVRNIAVQKKVGNTNLESQQTNNNFIRSPCEGLRSRKGKVNPTAQSESKGVNRNSKVAVGGGSSAHQCRKSSVNDEFVCYIEGCLMVFRTKKELQIHKRNRCTYKKCKKRFRNHKCTVRHQRAHNEERPLKCPWTETAASSRGEALQV